MRVKKHTSLILDYINQWMTLLGTIKPQSSSLGGTHLPKEEVMGSIKMHSMDSMMKSLKIKLYKKKKNN